MPWHRRRSANTDRVAFNLAPALKEALRAGASAEGISPSEAARRALAEWLEDRGHWPPPAPAASPAPLPLLEGLA